MKISDLKIGQTVCVIGETDAEYREVGEIKLTTKDSGFVGYDILLLKGCEIEKRSVTNGLERIPNLYPAIDIYTIRQVLEDLKELK
jgi:hypothetical protein